MFALRTAFRTQDWAVAGSVITPWASHWLAQSRSFRLRSNPLQTNRKQFRVSDPQSMVCEESMNASTASIKRGA